MRGRSGRSCSVWGSIRGCLGSGWSVKEGCVLREVVTGCCGSEFLALQEAEECLEDYTWMVDDLI